MPRLTNLMKTNYLEKLSKNILRIKEDNLLKNRKVK